MSNSYVYGATGAFDQRWNGECTTNANLNISRRMADYLREALDTIMDTEAADGILTPAGLTMTGNIDLDGHDLIIDTDGDSYLHASADDTVVLVLAGAAGQTWTTAGTDLSGTLDVTGAATFDSTISAASIGAGTDDSVVVLTAAGLLKTDEIDTRVWGSTLVDGGGTAGYLSKWSDADTLADSVLYDDGSSIGLGTTGPDRLLDILDATNPQLRLTHTDGTVYAELQGTSTGNLQVTGSGGALVVGTDDAASALSGRIEANSSTTGIGGVLALRRVDTSIEWGNTLGMIDAMGDDPAASHTGARIQFVADGTWDTDDYATYISILTDHSGTLTEEMKIDSAGVEVAGTLGVTGAATFSSTVSAASIGADTDDTVVILNAAGLLKTDEIDSRVWGSTLVDGSGTAGYLSKWSDADTLADSIISDDGSTATVSGALTVTGNIESNGTLFDLDSASTAYIRADAAVGSDAAFSLMQGGTQTYKLYYDYNGGTSFFSLWTTDKDGSGTDGYVMTVYDGTDDVIFGGSISVTGSMTFASLTMTGNLDLDGYDLLIDADGDSYLHASADDTVVLVVAGAAEQTWTAAGTQLAGTLGVTGAATFSSTISAASIGTGTDDSVVVLTAAGLLKTDEIDTRVWGSTLVDGSGTAGYLSKWSDADTLADSVLYDDGSSIGLGTATPAYALDVCGPDNTIIAVTHNVESSESRLSVGALGGYFAAKDDAGTQNVIIRSYAVSDVQAYFLAGSIGLGTATPATDLELLNSTSGPNIRLTGGAATYPSVQFYQAANNRGSLYGESTGLHTNALLFIFDGGVRVDDTLDVNGNELILDLDGDTSITADTDDRVDFKVAGADELHLSTTALYPATSDGLGLGGIANHWGDLYLSNGGTINWNNGNARIDHSAGQLRVVGNLDIHGYDLLLDGDLDSYLHDNPGVGIEMVVDAGVEQTWTATGSTFAGTLGVTGAVTFDSTVSAASIGADTDDTVVILNAAGLLKTDEIDSRVWGSTLVDGGGTAGYLSKWSDADTLADSIISDDGSTATVSGALTVTGNIESNGTLFDLDSASTAYIRADAAAASDAGFSLMQGGTQTYKLYYDYNGGTSFFSLWTTDKDGSGTDGYVMTVYDGTDDVIFGGSISVTGSMTFASLTMTGNLDLDGYDLLIDADGDSYLHASADDTVVLVMAGAAEQTWTAAGTQLAGTLGVTGAATFSSTVSGAFNGTIGATTPAAGAFTTVTTSGILSVDDTTDSTSGITGSIHTDGGLGVAKDVYVGDDLLFASGAVINWNAGNVTLTHSADALAFAGGTSYSFDDEVSIADYIAHTGDADSYFGFDAADAWQLVVGGETFIDITEDGTQDVIKLGDGGDIDINLAGGADGALFVQGSTGNVGIGTTTPGAKLDVVDGSVNEIARFTGAGNPAGVYIYNTRAAANTMADLRLDATLAGTDAPGNAAIIGYQRSGLDAGDLKISTKGTSDALVIKNTGNVGIGTTTPDRKLDILDATNPQLRLTHTDGTVYAELQGTSGGDLAITGSGGGLSVAADLTVGTTLDVTGAATFDSTISAASIGADTDDTVVILNAAGLLKTDEIDSRVWGSTLVDGSGTAGYLSKWSDADTLADSVLYDDGTNIGLGTATPAYALDVCGPDATSIAVTHNVESSESRLSVGDLGGYFSAKDDAGTQNVIIRSYAISDVQAYFLAGSIGLGTATPATDLELLNSTSGPNIRLTGGAATYPSVQFYQAANNRGSLYGESTGLHTNALLFIFDGGVRVDDTLDVNGNELILDLDGDTSITADTDDRVDFKVAGADELHLSTTALYPATSDGLGLGGIANHWGDLYLSNGGTINWNNGNARIDHSAGQLRVVGNLDIHGYDLLLDGDLDSYLHDNPGVGIEMVVDAGVEQTWTATGSTFAGTLGVTGAVTLSSTLDLNGNDLFTDADSDSYLHSPADAELAYVGDGTEFWRTVSNGALVIGHTASVSVSTDMLIQVHGNAASSAFPGISSTYWVNSAVGTYLVLGKSRSATIGSNTIIADDDDIGTIQWAADDGTDMNSIAASLRVEIDAAPGANDTPGRMILATTADGAATPTDRLTIYRTGTIAMTPDAGGYVKAECASIEIEYSTAAYLRIDAGTGYDASVQYQENGTTKWLLGYDASANYFQFYNSTQSADNMRLPDGNVSVQGNATFSEYAFDYVCSECGWHTDQPAVACGRCGALAMEWHDDVALMDAAVHDMRQRQTIDRLERLGLVDTYGTMGTGKEEMFVSMNRMPWFLMSGLVQERDRAKTVEDELREEIARLQTRVAELESVA